MVKVIMGLKGTGKTKQMIDLINTAVDTEHGNVVAIAHNSKLNYDIHYSIRLVDTSDYNIPNYDTCGASCTACTPATTTSPTCSSRA